MVLPPLTDSPWHLFSTAEVCWFPINGRMRLKVQGSGRGAR